MTRGLRIVAACRVAALAALSAGLLLPGSIASAQVSTLRPRSGSPNDEVKARIIGVLTHTRVNVRFEDAPAREAFARLGQALNLTLVARYADDKVGHGIDPATPITLYAEGRFALDVLEEALEQCEVCEDCTWQVRAGMLEVGTKRRLAVPAARERRIYDITDMLLEPPYFISPASDGMDWLPCESPYVDAVLGQKSRDALRRGAPPPGKSKGDLMLEFVEGMVETIEPGHWNLGDNRDEPVASAGADAARSAPLSRHPDEWASVRSFREGLAITAPDFVHRQINGAGPAIRPEHADTIVDVPPSGSQTGAAASDNNPDAGD